MRYELARDVSWRVLINNKISSLPIDLFEIFKAEGIHVLTYDQARTAIEALELEGYTLSNDAFSYDSTQV